MQGAGNRYVSAGTVTAGNYICSISVSGNTGSYGSGTNFAVISYDARGEYGALHVNEIVSAYSDTSRLLVGDSWSADVPPGEVFFEVTAAGSWTIACRASGTTASSATSSSSGSSSSSSSSGSKQPFSLQGSGNRYASAGVVGAGNYICTISVRGNTGEYGLGSNFAVISYAANGEYGGLHVNEIVASYSDTSRLLVGDSWSADVPPGEVFFEVTAEGSWTIACR